MNLLDRLQASGPKRILALDAGGIRGLISLGFLRRLEQLLRQRHQRPDLRLCEYFDLIGGVSTGAVIATGLALGMEVDQLQRIYESVSKRVFGKRTFFPFRASYNPRPLQEELTRILGDRTLGDDGVKTGLCIIAKRADTNSTWPLINHPRGRFFAQNRHIRLVDAIRASSAAPTYFCPVIIDVGDGMSGAFIDGAVSASAHPAFQLLLLATLQGFPFRWQTGADQLLMVSVGTGYWSGGDSVRSIAGRWKLSWATRLPGMFMEDAKVQSQLLMQLLSNSTNPQIIDQEMGDLSGDLLTPDPALTYLRYDAALDDAGLAALGLSELSNKLDELRDMREVKRLDDLVKIGAGAAAHQIHEQDLPANFDIDSPQA